MFLSVWRCKGESLEMKPIGPVDLCYFSGTGNTALAAGRMAIEFGIRGIETNLRAIEDTDPATLYSSGTVGIACPAAAFTTYPLVWRFVRNLRPGNGRGAFLLVTMGGSTWGLVGPMRALVESKGYVPLGAGRLVMPSNFMVKTLNDSLNAARRETALRRAASFAADLCEGRASWRWIRGLPDLVAKHLGTDRPFAWMRKKLALSADPAACTRCGLCAAKCPSSNIRMNDLPEFADRCELCMRCQSVCPVNAIRIRGKSFAQYRGKAEPWRADIVQQ